jgi:ferrous iron transport protein B
MKAPNQGTASMETHAEGGVKSAGVSSRHPVIPSSRHPLAALIGNPNTGKTTLFNALTGLRMRVGNYPGVTVETKKGHMTCQGRSLSLLDLPGTYSLAPRSPDEMLAVDLLLGQQPGEARPDVVISLVDASNLERNLYLTTQVLELGVPVVVALNMIDVAESGGIKIDAEKLAANLGVPVVPIQANKGRGLDRLRQVVAETAGAGRLVNPSHTGKSQPRVPFPEAFEQEVRALRQALDSVPLAGASGLSPLAGASGSCEATPVYLVERLLLDVGGYTESRLAARHPSLATLLPAARQRLAEAGCVVPGVEARARYGWIRTVTAGCIERPRERKVTWTDRLDRILTHKVWGTLIFLLLMFVVFQSIFTWTQPVMDWIKDGKNALVRLLQRGMPPGPLTSLLTRGVLEGVGSVLVFLPQIVILFGFIAILEDCGYMARAAFLMDKIMSRCGLSGKSFIPLLSSVACAVPGIMATRVIENRRDRLATILVAPLMSCSARLPVYALLIGAFLSPAAGYSWWVPGLTLFCMYLIGLVVAPLVALLLKRTLLRGETPAFVMEMPVYKWPSWRTVVRRMTDSGWMFVRRAGTLILATMIVIWALLYFPAWDSQGQSYDLRIAELNGSVQKQRGELEALEQSVAPQLEELDNLDEKGEAATPEERKRREELKKELAPFEAKAKPLRDVVDPVDQEVNRLQQEWRSQSLLGRAGKVIEPAVRPLGWDWRIGMAALASFPAREVMVGAMGIIYSQGEGDSGDARYQRGLRQALKAETWDGTPDGRKIFTAPVALSVMVFFALCCQCASTLAVIKRETNTWRWPVFTFVYMTVLAYVGALAVYQVGSLL